jgi:hypothetical protein
MATIATQLNSGSGFAAGETVTATKLNNLVNTATIAFSTANDTDDSTLEVSGNKLRAKDGGIVAAKLATGAVTGAAGGGKLAESAISGQTAITTLEGTDAFLVWDDTDDTLKKITQTNLSTQIVGDASITAAKINGVAKDGSGADLSVGTAPVFGCRAWVNFDTTRDSSGASNTSNTNRFIRAGGNVTSVLKNGAGDYTITFTTAMPDANYTVVGSACYTYPAGLVFDVVVPFYSVAPTTAAVRIATGQGGSIRDSETVNACVFR